MVKRINERPSRRREGGQAISATLTLIQETSHTLEMNVKWFYLLLLPVFMAKCYYVGLSAHNDQWFVVFYDDPSTCDLIWSGFWEIMKTLKDFNWASVEKMWDIFKKISDNSNL